jgi:hypothetical protein
MKWEKERHIKRSPTLLISVDENINLLKLEVKAKSLRKDV